MAETMTDHLLHSLEGLLPKEFAKFKYKLKNTDLKPRIPWGHLHEEITPVQLADLLLSHYGQSTAVLLTLHILRKMNQNLLAEQLHRALVQELLSDWWQEPSLTRTKQAPAGAGQGSTIRRNASSAGQLQNLCGSVRLRENLQGSGKKRPKSLESSIPWGDKEPAHYLPLLMQGRREKKTSSAPAGKSGMTGPVALSVAVPPSSGRPQDRVVCSLCHTQEGDPSAHETGGCPWCQASLPGKRGPGHEPQENPTVTSLSPKILPQCEHHLRQAQLLLCEDHREPICLSCSLSLGHRGHRICLTNEAAQGYKEQIQKQLEHLKEPRKSGEEQRSQGDKKKIPFLKATEDKKQKLRCQLKRLCRFLEQQEQLFVAWLEDLGQDIDQLRGAYSTRAPKDTLLEEQARELEAAQCQWALMQDIRGTQHRAQSLHIPELWAASPDIKEKLPQKPEFMDRRMKQFSETLHSGMEPLSADVTLDIETALPNLILSDGLRSVMLGQKGGLLPAHTEGSDAYIITPHSPSSSGCHYWDARELVSLYLERRQPVRGAGSSRRVVVLSAEPRRAWLPTAQPPAGLAPTAPRNSVRRPRASASPGPTAGSDRGDQASHRKPRPDVTSRQPGARLPAGTAPSPVSSTDGGTLQWSRGAREDTRKGEGRDRLHAPLSGLGLPASADRRRPREVRRPAGWLPAEAGGGERNVGRRRRGRRPGAAEKVPGGSGGGPG
ncbi:pyrin [Sorex fumeus]|uniref:pyrin n=1 Tax=Sorex fumeus TaxID=62283 RepID=UPI0024ADCE86|nr:pyrin [Sorex fumeus]